MDEPNYSNLSLNFSSDSRPYQEKKQERVKVAGNLRSRIKQRRALRREDAETSNAKSFENESRKRKLSGDESVVKGASPAAPERQYKAKKGNAVISSLFNKNPDIPMVQSESVEQLPEDVFTGRTFKDLPLHPFLVSNLETKLGFTEMTRVQQLTIPVLLKGKDALVKSQTGSGKTLAYAVPIVHALQSARMKVKRQDGPYALVIVPTRELVLQSFDAFTKLLKSFIWIVPGCLMGGEKRAAEKSRLRKGVNVLVSTPGRLLDHIKNTKILDFTKLQWLVIDEADRMLELGYERDIAQVLNAVKNDCTDPQTVLLSATLSQGVERLSSITLRNPENVDTSETSADKHVKPDTSTHQSTEPQDMAEGEAKEDKFTVPSQLQQSFLIAPCKLRLVSLAALILWKCKNTTPASKMIVFMSTQDAVRFHYQLFTSILCAKKKKTSPVQFGEDDVGFSDDSEDEGDSPQTDNQLKLFQLHGDMAQKERTDTYHKYIEAKSGVLLCTDVAARGLDLPHVDWIVQHTLPGTTVDYIHRIGRTARAGTKGQALLFLMPSEVDYVKILNGHKMNLTELQLSTIWRELLKHIGQLLHLRTTSSSRQVPRTVEEAATFLQDRFEENVLNNKELHELAGKGFQSYIRAYATYSREIKQSLKESRLHLGHVAKSFALRETPSKVQHIPVMSQSKKMRKTEKKLKEKHRARPLSFNRAVLSEYSSGLDSSSFSKKKNKHVTF